MYPDSAIGRSFAVIENLIIQQGGSAQRSQIFERLREADLLGDGPSTGHRASAILYELKHRGYVMTDNHGIWSLAEMAGS
jgi:hypothetical protein